MPLNKEESLQVKPQRMWVNSPSSLQQYSKYHGKNVLTVPPLIYGKGGTYIRIYFTEGSIVSINMHTLALDKGWI